MAKQTFETLRRDEEIALMLRGLYRQYGYRTFRMSRFEEYDFYMKNKEFLSSDQVITFSDLDGTLMALKPDVTLSIVKNSHAENGGLEKLYYSENVYRVSRDVREYREIGQVGLECIGALTPYTSVEVVSLAVKSLALISEEYMLDLSHMGFVNALVESLLTGEETKAAVRACLERKSAHNLSRLVAQGELSGKEGERIAALIALSGNLSETLPKAKALCTSPAMEEALCELESLCCVLERCKMADRLRLDFSVASDAKYYNGLMLRGYVKGASRAVLSGGRYDPLLWSMGRENLQAIGFAIYLDELSRLFPAPEENCADTLLLYDEKSSLSLLAAETDRRTKAGQSVLAAEAAPEGIAAKQILFVGEKEIREVEK